MNYSTIKFRSFVGHHLTSVTGFTIVELVTVLAIFAVVFNFAFPTFKTMVANNRISSQIHSFNGAISYARSEAVKQGRNVSIIPVNSGNWSNGWDIVLPGIQNTLLSHVDAFNGDTLMVSDTTVAEIQFTDEGRINTLNNIVFTLCHSNSTSQHEIIGKALTVSSTGITYLDSRYSCR